MRRDSGRLVATLVVVSFAWSIVGAGPALSDEDYDRHGYLDRSRGPYQGRVIDAETKAPLVGAVVLATWLRHKVYPFHMNQEFYMAREVLTDGDGRFRMEAQDIEAGAPRRTFRPEFVIFSPGYGWFPRYHAQPKGLIAGVFEGGGVTVELPRIRTEAERREIVGRLPPFFPPYEAMPKLIHLINIERTAVGFGRIGSREGK